MAVIFYPAADEPRFGSMQERIESLMEAAQSYKAAIMDATSRAQQANAPVKHAFAPKDIQVSFNWEEIALLLRLIRESTEANKEERLRKADLLNKLAEVYEVLRAAKMPKLEAVRLALITEANHLSGGSASHVG